RGVLSRSRLPLPCAIRRHEWRDSQQIGLTRSFSMNQRIVSGAVARAAQALIALSMLASAAAVAHDHERSTFVLTSTNDPGSNAVVVFRLDPDETSPLSHINTLPTGGRGGAGGNAGIVQFSEELGAVANFGSNTVTRLRREGDYILVAGTIELAPNCTKPDSV